jgi:uncharacterized RDD family membrane protein YckC
VAAPSGPRAGFWRRLGAVVLDSLLISIPLNILVRALGGDQAEVSALQTVVALAYYTYFEGSTGRTLGKTVLGIRVVDARSADPVAIGYGRAAIRHIMSYVSGVAIFIGYLWMLWDGERQTWHDKVASAYVVPADATRVTESPGDRYDTAVG